MGPKCARIARSGTRQAESEPWVTCPPTLSPSSILLEGLTRQATKQTAILKALTEGCSVRATARLVGVSKTTVLKLLVEAGRFCAIYQDHKLRNLQLPPDSAG